MKKLLFLLLFVFWTVVAHATGVILAWDPSPDTDVVGYTIYYGTASRTYTNTVTLGNVTNGAVTGLQPGITYYFAVTALNDIGLESEFSNEVSFTPPVVPSPPGRILITESWGDKARPAGFSPLALEKNVV